MDISFKRKINISNRLIVAIILISLIIFSFSGVYYYSQHYNNKSAISQMGARGDEVRQIQTKLKQQGYYKGTVDGIYGTATKNSVKSYQKASGLPADGIAGKKTLSYLGIASSDNGGNGQFSNNDIYLLAKVIAAEARGEPYIGQVAVGAVILNRVNHSSFPDSIPGVVYQPGAFSCVNDSNWSTEPNEESKKAARDALNGWDPCGGAIYYFNPAKTSNKWMRTRPVIITIGAHLFCS
ncbi:MAG: spore cortex-lytic enzyme [Oscillospiraceae bacterium]